MFFELLKAFRFIPETLYLKESYSVRMESSKSSLWDISPNCTRFNNIFRSESSKRLLLLLFGDEGGVSGSSGFGEVRLQSLDMPCAMMSDLDIEEKVRRRGEGDSDSLVSSIFGIGSSRRSTK